MTLSSSTMPDYTTARFNMVESQIRPNQVTDQRILDTMSVVPRELFVPTGMTGIAYIDEDVQIAPGRYLMEPMVLARLLQEAALGPSDRVLDVASATGYSSAIIAAMAQKVIALEASLPLSAEAERLFAVLRIRNISLAHGALTAGAQDAAPFDVIIVNGGMEVVPEALLAQLAEGGRLLGIFRRSGPAHASHLGEARLYEKNHGHVSYRPLFDANVRLLPGFEAKPAFLF